MPKATTEGGATNSWEPQPDPLLCAECGAQVAAGAPRCPECPSTDFLRVVELVPVVEADDDPPADDEAEAASPDAEPEPDAEEAAADEPQAPDAEPAPAPAAPPRTPPRRA